MVTNPLRLIKTTVVAFLLFPVSSAVAAQTPSISAGELVRRAVKNEAAASSLDNYFFRDEIHKPHSTQTKLMVQTKEGMAGLIVEIDGHPLTPEQQKDERARVERFINNPDELKKKEKQEKEDEERTTRIVRALPDAFLYEYDGTTMGNPELGKSGHELVRVKFRPNPDYSPPSRVEQVLTGMAGHLLIDSSEYRLAEIDGTLIQEVSFGWGIFGHLDKDGRFLVRQADVDKGHWEITHMELSFTGKILLFKSFSIKSEETVSNFHRVSPDLTFAQGVQLLEEHASKQDAPQQARK